MRFPDIHQQMFGDFNRRISRIRARMNREVKERYLQLRREKELKGGDANGSKPF